MPNALKSGFLAPATTSHPTTMVNARVPDNTVAAARRLAEQAGESLTEFVRAALENEVSRRTLCPPSRPVTMADLDKKLSTVLDLVAASKQGTSLQSEVLMAVHSALGLDKPA